MNTVRYSPDGEVFCSGGADGKAVLFNGKTGEKIGSLGGDKAHNGGIYAVSLCRSADCAKIIVLAFFCLAFIWTR